MIILKASLFSESEAEYARKFDELCDDEVLSEDHRNILRIVREKLFSAHDALMFYADPETYHACRIEVDPPTGGFDKDFDDKHGHDFYDREMPGSLARKTLNWEIIIEED